MVNQIVQSKKHFNLLLAKIEASKYIVVDTETTGLNVRKDKVIGIGFAFHQDLHPEYLPLYEYKNNQLNKINLDLDISSLLNLLKTKKLICHNAAYDLRIIKHNFGIDLVDSLYCDTLLLKHTCDEVPPFALKDIASRLFGADSKAEQIELKKSIKANGGQVTKKNYELYKADLDVIAKYCIQDCTLTYKIFEHYTPQLISDKLFKFFYISEVMPLYKEVTIPMQERGVKLDIELMKKTKIEITEDLKYLEDDIQTKLNELCPDFKKWFFSKYYPPKPSGKFIQILCEAENETLPKTPTGRLSISKKTFPLIKSQIIKDFIAHGSIPDEVKERVQMEMHCNGDPYRYFINIASKDHLRRIIFDFLGERPSSYTAKGGWAVDDALLQTIKHKYAFVPLLLNFNKLSKISSTYIDRFLTQQEDGIFYPSFQQHRTISGRYGSDLQQLPRSKESGDPMVIKYNNLCRQFFIAGPGHKFVGADQNSLEVRVFSHVSRDLNIQNVFKNGEDFYSKIAIMTDGRTDVSADKSAENYLGKVDKSARQRAKAWGLGIAYGLTGFKLAKELNIDQRDAEKIVKNYLKAFPQLHSWMIETDKKVVQTGEVVSIAGRKRRLKSAVDIYNHYGDVIFDDLELWKKYHEVPSLYIEAKEHRKTFKNAINNARNFQIQSLAASIINQSSININKKFKQNQIDALIVLNVHDEIVVHCKAEDVKKVGEIMQYEMENVFKLDIPLIAEPASGDSYGDTK